MAALFIFGPDVLDLERALSTYYTDLYKRYNLCRVIPMWTHFLI